MNIRTQLLFLASNKTPGQVAVGAMKVDGQAVSGRLYPGSAHDVAEIMARSGAV